MGRRKLPALLLAVFAREGHSSASYPHRGIHTVLGTTASAGASPNHPGENRISWPTGCCEGDLIVIDFRDEQGDGNDGEGMLSISGSLKYAIRGSLGYTWKTYGPYCAPEGWHNFTYTSDANPEETSFTITDSFGLVKASGTMDDFPVSFHTISPSKFCNPQGGLAFSEQQKRARKLLAYNDQFTPREQLEKSGYLVPQDPHPAGHPPLSVWYPTNSTKP